MAAAGDRPAEELYHGEEPVSFAVLAGPVVLARDGVDAVAVPSGGGSPRWRFAIGPVLPGTAPTRVGDVVMIPLAQSDLAGVELAEDERWRVPMPASQGTTSPLALPGGDAAYAFGDLVRVDAATGRVRWRRELWSRAIRTPAAGSPAVLGDVVVVLETGKSEDAFDRGDVATALAPREPAVAVSYVRTPRVPRRRCSR